jgi:hypothetical protein
MKRDAVQSDGPALCIINRPSGAGRTAAEISRLRQAFRAWFGSQPEHVFAIAENHAQVTQQTEAFLRTHGGAGFLLAGGGGGTTRALIQGLFNAVDRGSAQPEAVRLGLLRLGSGNLLARKLRIPPAPLEALPRIAAAHRAEQTTPVCVYRCVMRDSTDQEWPLYGLTLGGLGQFGRVPGDIARWSAPLQALQRGLLRRIPLETQTTLRYLGFTLARHLRCLLQPARAELIAIEQAGRRTQLRLLSGMLLNFDAPQFPLSSKCTPGELRLRLACLPFVRRSQAIRDLVSRRSLVRHLHSYDITSANPVTIRLLERPATRLALDEDTFVAPAHIRFEIAGLVRCVTLAID